MVDCCDGKSGRCTRAILPEPHCPNKSPFLRFLKKCESPMATQPSFSHRGVGKQSFVTPLGRCLDNPLAPFVWPLSDRQTVVLQSADGAQEHWMREVFPFPEAIRRRWSGRRTRLPRRAWSVCPWPSSAMIAGMLFLIPCSGKRALSPPHMGCRTVNTGSRKAREESCYPHRAWRQNYGHCPAPWGRQNETEALFYYHHAFHRFRLLPEKVVACHEGRHLVPERLALRAGAEGERAAAEFGGNFADATTPARRAGRRCPAFLGRS